MRGILCVLVFLSFGGSVAEATTIGFLEGDGRFTVNRYIVKGESEADRLDITYEARADVFVISAEDRINTTLCGHVNRHTVRCDGNGYYVRVAGHEGHDTITVETTGEGYRVVQIDGGDGRDRLKGTGGELDGVRIDGEKGADRVVGSAGEQELNGGIGADVILGGSGGDSLGGGPGHDVLRGGPGADNLGDFGVDGRRSGSDAFYGGPGNDGLETADRVRDRVIDCGRGVRDVGIRDRSDPDPISCERDHYGGR